MPKFDEELDKSTESVKISDASDQKAGAPEQNRRTGPKRRYYWTFEMVELFVGLLRV